MIQKTCCLTVSKNIINKPFSGQLGLTGSVKCKRKRKRITNRLEVLCKRKNETST